jgi:hypothetical protein
LVLPVSHLQLTCGIITWRAGLFLEMIDGERDRETAVTSLTGRLSCHTGHTHEASDWTSEASQTANPKVAYALQNFYPLPEVQRRDANDESVEWQATNEYR